MIDYNKLADDYARHRQVHPEVLKDLFAVANIRSTSRVLEVGCGTGNYIIMIQSLTGCAAWGIDPSDQMLAKAGSRESNVAFSLARAEALAQPSGLFDLVFTVDVIHHIGDRRRHFAEAWRVLRTGGRLCTVTDSEWIIRNRPVVSGYFPETAEHELRRYPRIEVLCEEMRQAGFSQLEEHDVEYPAPLTGIGPFRDKAYSALHLITQAAFERGLACLQADLRAGPIPNVSRYALVWGQK
jgi:ubiquinone/menaquinone biosynthesis C-methylase UbiE